MNTTENTNPLDLVFFDQSNFMKANVVTTSRMIATKFGKQHDNVLRDIRGIIKSVAKSRRKGLLRFGETSYTHPQNNQTYTEYQLNAEAFTFLVMSYTGEKAVEFKLEFISKFKEMSEILAGTRQMRSFGILQRNELTKAIQAKLHRLGDDFIYSRITNLCYKHVFGKSFKQLKDFYEVKDVGGLRDFVRQEKLDDVAKLEQKVAIWIEDFDLNEKQVSEKLIQMKKKENNN